MALGNDAVNAEAQDGGGVNNANFGTPPDGARPRMQMYLWNLSTPERDGDFDNGIIVHEYGHGVSNRLTGGPSTTGCLSNQEQGGEGWSDYLAYMMTMPTGTEPASGRGIGTYALNQPTNGLGIRTQKYSRNMAVNNHTYDDIKTMAVPHGVGEVWATMLWDLTYDLIDEYGFNANLITGNAGNNKSLQLVMDGMKLQPCSPGFVDARDAILAADVANYGGANQCLIWNSFARRGLGFSAVQGSSGSRTDGTEAFDLPSSCNGVALTTTATPSPVPAGQQLTYNLHLENTAGATVNGVSVTSEPGAHVSYVSGSANCGGTYNAGTDTVTFPIGTMTTGATRDCQFRVLVDNSPYGNVAFSDDFEPNLSNWVASHGAGTQDWSLTTTGPHSPTHAAFSSDPATVSDQYLRLGLARGHHGGRQAVLLAQPRPGVDVRRRRGGGLHQRRHHLGRHRRRGLHRQRLQRHDQQLLREPDRRPSGLQRHLALRAVGGQPGRLRRPEHPDPLPDRHRLLGQRSGWTVDDVHIGNDVSTTNHFTLAATGFPTQTQDVTTQIVAPAAPRCRDAPTVTNSTPGRVVG